MEDEDYQKLLNIVTNEESNTILHTSLQDISKRKENLLKELHLPKEDENDLLRKLKNYRYVMELPDLEIGNYIRWINLKDPTNISLTQGGLIIDIKICQGGIQVVCKNFRNKKFQIKIDECFIFQKLTDQEKIILSALDYLNEK